MATADDKASFLAAATAPAAAAAGEGMAPPSGMIGNSHVVMTPGTCGGTPRIAGTRIRVRDVVQWTEAGHSPHEIVAMFPQLSLGDVHGALAFYHDNREFVDRLIRDEDDYAERMMRERPAGPRKQTLDRSAD